MDGYDILMCFGILMAAVGGTGAVVTFIKFDIRYVSKLLGRKRRGIK